MNSLAAKTLHLLRLWVLITAFGAIAGIVVVLNGGGPTTSGLVGCVAGIVAVRFHKRLAPIRSRRDR